MLPHLNDFDLALLFRLLIAHFVGDFILQKRSWINDKLTKKWFSGSLYLHVFIIGALSYLFSGYFTNLWIPAVVMITHYFTDVWKSLKGDILKFFLLDQLIHIFIIFLAWYFYIMPDIDLISAITAIFNNPVILTIILAYLFVIWPAGYLIAKITKPWQEQFDSIKGLQDAGRWIGMIERILILTFVLINQFTGIGFLIAAKSILRFSDIKNAEDRKEAEYILLGTMVSFIFAIFVGLLAVQIIKHH
jgi:hypothetical protein